MATSERDSSSRTERAVLVICKGMRSFSRMKLCHVLPLTAATTSPAAMKALQDVADDPNGMVRTVARKAITADAEAVSPHPQD